jgi:hypothetical protein
MMKYFLLQNLNSLICLDHFMTMGYRAEVENCVQGVGEQTYRMLNAGFPINHPQVQKNLRMLTQDRIPDIRKGCVPLPGSFYLMGTSDPTENKVLKRNQVAIAM